MVLPGLWKVVAIDTVGVGYLRMWFRMTKCEIYSDKGIHTSCGFPYFTPTEEEKVKDNGLAVTATESMARHTKNSSGSCSFAIFSFKFVHLFEK